MKETVWYRQALQDSMMCRGNNARLKKVIERAGRGEEITLAVIGGSITEGEGAAVYPECWAVRFREMFGRTYGTAGGRNVHLVNAGVGGTPSPFGLMRYERDVLKRMSAEDADGLPDAVVVEFSVNDWVEPTGHRCFESLVKTILDAPNEPAVMLLFSVFQDGSNLQDMLKKVGENYDLMMVSIRDGVFPHVGKELTGEAFFHDRCHPTSLGHGIMADCLMHAVRLAAEAETDKEPDRNVPPVYGTDFMGLRTVFGDTVPAGVTVERGGFRSIDEDSYHNEPLGWVCGPNFHHDAGDPTEPLRVQGVFHKCLAAWRATPDPAFGAVEMAVDGKTVKTVCGNAEKWGQSEVVLVLDEQEPAEHTLEIRVTEAGKKATITAIGLV